MGWIKFWKDQADDPRVVTAAAELAKRYHLGRKTSERGGLDLSATDSIRFWCNAVTGALVTLWVYADEHIHDDDSLEITSESVDAIVGLEGFFEVIPRDWVDELDDGRIVLPGYCEKNSLITKRKRARKSNARVTQWRRRNIKARNAGVTHSVTHSNAAGDIDQDLDKDNKNKKGPTDPVELGTRPGPVDRVFDHWKATWKHPRARLDPKRRRIIANALKGYSETDLRAAISGYLNSSHHCGENDRRAVYDEIGLFLRDAAHIDAGLAFGQEGTNGPAKPELRFYSADEHRAYQAAVAQGRSFADQAAWEAYRDGQAKTH